jgi:hypothetical protein
VNHNNSAQPLVTLEFVGFAEQRAGRKRCELRVASVEELLRMLSCRFPQFVVCGPHGGVQLHKSWILNINGDRFVGGFNAALRNNDIVLLMSMDAGG